MRRRFLASAATLGLISSTRAEERTAHRIIMHVGSSDPALMRTALNTINAAQEGYAARGETVSIELVANGGGYAMLRADVSPVRMELAAIRQRFPAVVFSACQNSRRGVAEAEHKAIEDIPEVSEATDVPAGIVRLTELQEQGWSYIRV